MWQCHYKHHHHLIPSIVLNVSLSLSVCLIVFDYVRGTFFIKTVSRKLRKRAKLTKTVNHIHISTIEMTNTDRQGQYIAQHTDNCFYFNRTIKMALLNKIIGVSEWVNAKPIIYDALVMIHIQFFNEFQLKYLAIQSINQLDCAIDFVCVPSLNH